MDKQEFTKILTECYNAKKPLQTEDGRYFSVYRNNGMYKPGINYYLIKGTKVIDESNFTNYKLF
jgi:hypothetical protein